MTITHSDRPAIADAPELDRREMAVRQLQDRCGGIVHLPGSADFEALRRPWNVAVEQMPAAVAAPTSVSQVATVVRAATDLGLRITAQSTGHAAAPLAGNDLTDAVLVRTVGLRGVHVDPVRRIARVEAGARWGDVVAAAAEHGLAALHGSAPHVGVAGYTLGGGLGWYARQHGLAAHGLVAAEVVTAAGDIVSASAYDDSELLWALRGGGGNFGIVTVMELELHDIGRPYAGMMLWDGTHAEAVLRTWATWCESAPESATTSFRIMRFPPLPQLPPFLSGRTVVIVDGAVIGSEEHGRRTIAALRALAPEIDTFAVTDPADLPEMHMDPVDPTPSAGAGAVIRELSDEAITAFLDAVGPEVDSALLLAELRHVGGALARPADAALSHISGSHVALFLAIAPTAEARSLGERATQEVADALAPWTTGESYLNFAERPVDPRRGFTEEARTRLLAVRSRLDPRRRLIAAHGLD
jgi:FAD/FMN-containing dehydrogenase